MNIDRSNDNKINFIAYDDKTWGKDTTYYNYETVSQGTKITARWNSDFDGEGSEEFIFDNENKILSYVNPNEELTKQFFYNADKSLNKITLTGSRANLAEFTYQSGIADAKEDILSLLLFGKDFYLRDLKDLNPYMIHLDSDYDDNPWSFTKPHHMTLWKDTHQPDGDEDGIETLSSAYELNENSLLSKITYNSDSNVDYAVVLFKY